MFMLLLFLVSGESPKWATPADEQHIWVIAQDDGQLPHLSLWSSKSSHAVAAPPQTLVAVDGLDLFVIHQSHITRLRWVKNSWQQQDTWTFQKPHPIRVPFWLLAQTWTFEGLRYWAWSCHETDQNHLIIAWAKGDQVTDRVFPLPKPYIRPSSYQRTQFTTPILEKRGHFIWWIDGKTAQAFDLSHHKLHTFDMHELKGTYRYFQLWNGKSVDWLCSGGPAGSFGELGFQLGTTGTKTSGITIRILVDPLSQGTRVAVVTTEASVSSQLISALSDSRKIQVHLMRLQQGEWQIVSTTKMRFDTDERTPFQETSMDMFADFNQDGFADLVFNDGSRNMRVWMSNVVGGLSQNSADLGPAADILVSSSPYAIRFDYRDTWTWSKVTP